MRAFLSKALVFFMTFSLEVSVHAAESELLQEPHGCFASKGVCALQNINDGGFEFKIGQTIVTLDRDSSLIRKSDSEIRLVKGTAWIKAKSAFVVGTEFGTAKNLEDGDFWVTKSAQALTAIAISTDVELAPKGSIERLLISQGLQNTLGQIGFNGQATTGIPMPIPFKDHVMRWARLYRGPKKDFERQLDVFHEKWQRASEASAQINRALYDRRVASVEEAKRAEEAKRSKVEAENQALRKMFRQRMLNGM
jgi:hypothetical protein